MQLAALQTKTINSEWNASTSDGREAQYRLSVGVLSPVSAAWTRGCACSSFCKVSVRNFSVRRVDSGHEILQEFNVYVVEICHFQACTQLLKIVF
jgi:hypothetical protein